MSSLHLWGSVPERFEARRIGEISTVQTGPFGSQLHSEDYVDFGTPIVTVEHLGENFFTHQNLPQVSDQDVERLSKYRLQPGDIVFSRVGSVDRRSLVREAEDGWLFSGRCLRIRPDPELVCPRYLSYFLGHPGVRDYIRSIAVGATMPSLNTKLLRGIPIYLPELKEQRKIGEILSSFDAKIECNRQTARKLEELARRLFKSWFVEFDPVRAKTVGRQPALMPPETAALFPNKLVDSPLGPIPEGWDVRPLSQLTAIKSGKRPPSRFVEQQEFTPIPVYGGAGIMAYTEEVLFDRDIILTGRVGAIGNVMKVKRGSWPSDNTLVLIPSSYFEFVYQVVSQVDFEIIKKGSTQPLITQTDLMKTLSVVPSSELLEVFEEIAREISNRIDSLQSETDVLSRLRDRLLPKLISGEIRVPEEVEMAEEA